MAPNHTLKSWKHAAYRHSVGIVISSILMALITITQYSILNHIGMTSSQSSVSELVTVDQAQKIVRAHLAGHNQSIVKSLNQIENKGYRQVSFGCRSGCPRT